MRSLDKSHSSRWFLLLVTCLFKSKILLGPEYFFAYAQKKNLTSKELQEIKLRMANSKLNNQNLEQKNLINYQLSQSRAWHIVETQQILLVKKTKERKPNNLTSDIQTAYEWKFILPLCNTGSIPVEHLCIICLNEYVANRHIEILH